MTESRSVVVQKCLDRLKRGDESARKELLNSTCERLGQLTHTMLKDYARLKRWEQTDDVLQSALVRLYRALHDVTPESPRQFYRLAALQIRRELIDLARHYYGPEGQGRVHQTNAEPSGDGRPSAPLYDRAEADAQPDQLAAWTEFHRQAEALPDEEREVFDLIYYQGLSYAEAAEVLDVSAKTVMRRWQSACLRLHDAVGGRLPGL